MTFSLPPARFSAPSPLRDGQGLQGFMPYAAAIAVTLSLLAGISAASPASGAGKKSSAAAKSTPSGTLLLPLTPKIDDGRTRSSLDPSPLARFGSKQNRLQLTPEEPPTAANASTPSTGAIPSTGVPHPLSAGKLMGGPASNKAVVPAPVSRTARSPELKPQTGQVQPAAAAGSRQPADISAESAPVDENSPDAISEIDENSLLKGTVQIVADDTEYDQQKNTFLGTGNAVAVIAGQDSKLEADTILYDQNSQTIDARGNVKILRNGQLTTGSSFRFKVNSDEYLITDPDTELQGTTVIARSAQGTKQGMTFKNGTIQMPQPIHITNNGNYGPTSTAEENAEKAAHPDAFLPVKPSYVFKARKMVYESYKKDGGNLTVFGGKVQFGNFSVPMPKFTANVAQDNTRVTFPVTPVIGNNLQVGGLNIGPSFNYGVGRSGAFSWSPLLQIGGRNNYGGGTENNSGKLGAGARIGFVNDVISTHLAYGSVSNILVGDFKAKINKNTTFQSGINRFLNDGMFGMRRARLIAEVVNIKNVTSIPFISVLSFRSSAGWAQDSPGLVNLSGSQYAQLFKQTNSGKVGAYRLQEQVTAVTHPIFSVGNDKYGAQMQLFGGAAARAYSSGDSMLMGQFGPLLNMRLNKVRLQGGYTQSGVSGQSPFVFDQFIQGTRSCFVGGDVKVTKYLTLGANLGYNLDAKMLYGRTITAAIGPDDFKLLLSRDTIRGMNRFGFDVLYGQPIPYSKLVLKGNPDAGQLGGI